MLLGFCSIHVNVYFFVKTYILMKFIQYYKKKMRRNHTFYHYTFVPNGKWNFLKSLSPPRYRYSRLAWLYIHKRSWHDKWGPVSRGSYIIHGFLYLGKGDWRWQDIQNVILFTYLRSTLIFIKQYSDSMCFSSILAWNYESYLIYVK